MSLALPCLWTSIDSADDPTLLDTPQEAEQFQQHVKEEVKGKLVEVDGGGAGSDTDKRVGGTPVPVTGVQSSRQSTRPVQLPPPSWMPSFHPSHILNHSTPYPSNPTGLTSPRANRSNTTATSPSRHRRMTSTPGASSSASKLDDPTSRFVTTPTAGADQTTIGPTLDEAPSRTRLMTTPIPARGSRGPLREATDKGDITATPLVASPIDTPDSMTPKVTDAPISAASPEVITPLGNAKMRGKSYLSLTKHFEAFERAVNKTEKAARGRSASKSGLAAPARQNSVGLEGDVTGAGGVLSGCRFCVPPDLGVVSKHKQRWDIINKLGGKVVLTPDTAITHIIYDGKSAVALARELGIESIGELPEGAVCVKWDWIVQCKLNNRKLDPGPWLSFRRDSTNDQPVAGPSRPPSRLIDITEQLRPSAPAAMGARKRRDATASDSETESSKRIRPKRPQMSPVLIARPFTRTASSPAKISGGKSRLVAAGEAAVAKLAVAQSASAALQEKILEKGKGKGKEKAVDPGLAIHDVATDHGPGSSPQWGDKATQDGLDIMISGVQSGSVEDASDEETHDPDTVGEEQGNPCVMADRFKCGQAHDGTPKDPGDHPNEWLAKKFDELSDMYSGAKYKNEWQLRGYRNDSEANKVAAAAMRRTKWSIGTAEQAISIKGIGASMKDRIDEFITGRLGRQYYDMNEQMAAVSAFAKIYGIGKNQANALWDKGARTIADLSQDGNPYNLTSGQLTGLALYDDLNTRIPRAECKEIYEIVRDEAKRADKKVWIEIMGSYRRGSETSGDVDFLITRDTADGGSHRGVLRKLVGGLIKKGTITHELSLPHDWDELEAKWMGVCKLPNGLHRRIDVLCIPFEQWGAALLYFTGNDIFNRSLRLYARKMGYSLNQRGLSVGVIRGKDGLKFTEGEIVASRTEEEIFARLGLKWRPPHQRRP